MGGRPSAPFASGVRVSILWPWRGVFCRESCLEKQQINCVLAGVLAPLVLVAIYTHDMKPWKENGAAISSEEINFLVFRYLQESGEDYCPPLKTAASRVFLNLVSYNTAVCRGHRDTDPFNKTRVPGVCLLACSKKGSESNADSTQFLL